MKQKLSLFLALALITLSFTACGAPAGSSASSGASGDAAASSGASGDTATPAATDEWPAIGTADAPIALTMVLKDVMPDEPAVAMLFDAISEKMAAHGQYITLTLLDPPASSYGTALPLAVRSGEYEADIVYFQGGDLPLTQEGLLEDLTPYIEKSTHVKSLLEPANLERVKNYPYLLWLAPARVATPVMRTDWAESLDSYKALLADPTPDNYYKMVKEMKDKGLIEYGFSGDGSLERLDAFFNQAFGVTSTFVKEGERWAFTKATKAERDKLEYYAKLYAEGLLDPEYLTNQWDALEQKFYDGKLGVMAGTAGAVIKIYDDKMKSAQGEGATLTVLPPAKGVGDKYIAIDVTKESRGMALLSDRENKDAAFAVLEFMASPEGRILDKVGIEGTHYNVQDGKIVFTDRFNEWWSRFWETTYNFNPQPPLAQPVYSPAAQSSLDMAQKYYVADNNIIIPEELAPQYDAMLAVYNEFATDIVRGVKPISAFDEMVTKWNAAGGDAFAEHLATVMK